MPTQVEAIKNFLNLKTHESLAKLYSRDMECQVNAAQDNGERVEGDYRGKRWHGWSDEAGNIWKTFRIPYKAATSPEYEDKRMSWDLAVHAEGIGMTGWDWKNRVSRWVAFDFDSIINHKNNACTHEELEEIKRITSEIPWVTIRKSTSGQGLHLYVFLDSVPTNNHGEHAALARSILAKISAIAGYNFESKVDACGGNMWVWHRKMEGDGLKVVKQGGVLNDVPPNWKDHVKVVQAKRKNLNHDIGELDYLANSKQRVKLDSTHKKLIDYLEENKMLWWWDNDLYMLVTHTFCLKTAHNDLGFVGIYDTTSPGSNIHEQNCFCFPMKNGGWSVRRYTPGIQEHESWDQDAGGWTRTYLNVIPDFARACRSFGGVEDPKGGFVFREAEVARQAAELLGVKLNFDSALASRETILKPHKDGRLLVELGRQPNDPPMTMEGWYTKNNKPWTKIYNVQLPGPPETESFNMDDVVRNVITESDENYGWFLKIDDRWIFNQQANVKSILASMGLNHKEINNVLGNSIQKSYRLVNKPFDIEYPGDRQWNRNAARLRFAASDNDKLEFPTWMSILNHCGAGLDEIVKTDKWCNDSGIISGADYLMCWVASLFQEPTEPLPYLFFYGPQNSGKSSFHEALSLLVTRGYMRGDAAVISQGSFNAELENAIICVIEETNLNKNKLAYNRIKDWVTSRELLIHKKGQTPYQIPNTTHWIQCANEHTACPVFPGDTRITMSYVASLEKTMPKKKMIPKLMSEAPDFIKAILDLELPISGDRLNIPILTTMEKTQIASDQSDLLSIFIHEHCVLDAGFKIKFSDFYDAFIQWCPPDESNYWTKIRLGKELNPAITPKGRERGTGQFYIGNIRFQSTPKETKDFRYTTDSEDYLMERKKCLNVAHVRW